MNTCTDCGTPCGADYSLCVECERIRDEQMEFVGMYVDDNGEAHRFEPDVQPAPARFFTDQRIDNLMYYVLLALCVVMLVSVTLAIFGNHVAPDRCNEVTHDCFMQWNSSLREEAAIRADQGR